MSTDTVRVNVATAEPTAEGVELRMRTVGGPEVTFLLDDLAIGLLGLTLQGVLQLRKEQVGDEQKNIRIFKEDNEK